MRAEVALEKELYEDEWFDAVDAVDDAVDDAIDIGETDETGRGEIMGVSSNQAPNTKNN